MEGQGTQPMVLKYLWLRSCLALGIKCTLAELEPTHGDTSFALYEFITQEDGHTDNGGDWAAIGRSGASGAGDDTEATPNKEVCPLGTRGDGGRVADRKGKKKAQRNRGIEARTCKHTRKRAGVSAWTIPGLNTFEPQFKTPATRPSLSHFYFRRQDPPTLPTPSTLSHSMQVAWHHGRHGMHTSHQAYPTISGNIFEM